MDSTLFYKDVEGKLGDDCIWTHFSRPCAVIRSHGMIDL